MFRRVWIVVASLVLVPCVWAQRSTAEIVGAVTDSSGGAIAGGAGDRYKRRNGAAAQPLNQSTGLLHRTAAASGQLPRLGQERRFPSHQENRHHAPSGPGSAHRFQDGSGRGHRNDRGNRQRLESGYPDLHPEGGGRCAAHSGIAPQRQGRQPTHLSAARRLHDERYIGAAAGRLGARHREPGGVLERRPRQHGELHARRRVSQRHLHQRQPRHAEPRRPAGVQRSDQQLQRRVRAQRRRGGECRHALRHQQHPRQPVRVRAQQRFERAELFRHHGRRIEAQPVRRVARRPGLHSEALQRPRPHVFLLLLPGDPAGAEAGHFEQGGAHRAAAQRRLLRPTAPPLSTPRTTSPSPGTGSPWTG